MKTTSIKGVLSFCVAVTVTVAMAYSAVTVIQKNNAATEKAVKESQAIGSEVSTDSLKDGEYEGTATGYGGPLTVRITIKGGKLTDIKVVSHTETPEYFSRASAVIGKILNSGSRLLTHRHLSSSKMLRSAWFLRKGIATNILLIRNLLIER